MTLAAPDRAGTGHTRLATIDCDIHNYLPSDTTLRKYLSERWCRYLDHFAGRVFHGLYYPLASQHAARTDAWPPSGLSPGSDLSFMQEQLLNRWDLEHGILLPLLGAGKQLNLEWGGAMSRAANDWQAAELLDAQPRPRGAVGGTYEGPHLALAQIPNRATGKRFSPVRFESPPHQTLCPRQ